MLGRGAGRTGRTGRPPRLLGGVVIASGLAGLLAGCGGGGGVTGLKVSSTLLSPGGQPVTGAVPEGQSVTLQVTVTNQTARAVSGVAVRIALPSQLTYVATAGASENGDVVRTADVDPATSAAVPVWGAWELGPSVPGAPSQVVLTVTLKATGAPGHYSLIPRVFAAGTSSVLVGPVLAVSVSPAASLQLSLRATPPTVPAGKTVLYQAVVTNSGAGPAGTMALSITLPENFVFLRTLSTGGNASGVAVVMPNMGTTVPNWSGFSIPGASSSGPGVLTVAFEARVLAIVPPGVYSSTAGLISGTGSNILTITNGAALAPVTVP
ncbi:MAG TPA: hypothetical protein VMW49_07895 [Candidatus Dormibacteraeota bacterium]|nr:hypothetical protein [Candidatus Dormibacteraeota bacterium]